MIPDYSNTTPDNLKELNYLISKAVVIPTKKEAKIYNFATKELAEAFSKCLINFHITGRGERKYVDKFVLGQYGVALKPNEIMEIQNLLKNPVVSKTDAFKNTVFIDNYNPNFQLLENVNKTKQVIHDFRKAANAPSKNNSIEALGLSDIEISKAINETEMLIPEDVKELAADFLKWKWVHGTPIERAVYKNMSVETFLHRLLTKRPLVFFTDNDAYLAEGKDKPVPYGKDDFDAIGTIQELNLSLTDYLSYDEMQISAFLGFATPTFFINEGDRNNNGVNGKKGTFIENGVYSGLVGARFERPGKMEDEHMIVRAPSPRNARKDEIWAKFYGLDRFPTLSDVDKEPNRFIKLKDGEFLDLAVYKACMKKRLEAFMADAANRGSASKPAYIHLVGLGLGVWAPHASGQNAKFVQEVMKNIQFEVYQEIIKAGDFKNVSDLDFSYFFTADKPKINEFKDKNGHVVHLHFTNNNPAQITEEKKGKTLVALFAWDSNSFPGNEYWLGPHYFAASGDPAAVCSSTAVDTFVGKFLSTIAFKWQNDEIRSNYSDLVNSKKIKINRQETNFVEEIDSGGAVNIGYHYSSSPNAKIGVMLAANSGVPGGALGKKDKIGHVIPKDMAMKTQEESIWANAVLTTCGEGLEDQKAFHSKTIQNKWGMLEEGKSTDTHTRQGIDFTKTKDANDYNGAYVVDICRLSAVDKNKQLVDATQYPVLMVFSDSINANPNIGTEYGTMKRTLNQEAIHNYDFFKQCVKMKLRSGLDAMASSGVTHALVARLSAGIYAGKHKEKFDKDFNSILQEVLDEKVGPNGEKRGQFFEKVIIPKLS